jgi:hypothetical protein
MNMDCTGCVIIAMNISGYNVYRRMEMINAVMKKNTLMANITTDAQYSQVPL